MTTRRNLILYMLFFLVILIYSQSEANGWKISTSSYLKNDPKYAHYNLLDKSLNTAWVEGAKDEGNGEWVLIKFYHSRRVKDIGVFNGYQKSLGLFEANNRVKELEITSEGSTMISTLTDEQHVQWIPLHKETEFIKFKIITVYKGKKYNDTCLTELIFSDKVTFIKLNEMFNNYFDKKIGIDDIYAFTSMDDIRGLVFYNDYLPLESSEKSIRIVFDLINYNEKIYKEKKINNVFVAESCNEVLQEKILNYPNKLISYINAQYPEELRLIIDAYKRLKINYINDVKGMILVKERFNELYDECYPDTKKLLKDVVD